MMTRHDVYDSRFRDLGSYGSPKHDRSVHEPRIEVVKVEDLLILPGRRTRPPQIVVILRGLPGSGKTYVGKLIKVCCHRLENEITPQRLIELGSSQIAG